MTRHTPLSLLSQSIILATSIGLSTLSAYAEIDSMPTGEHGNTEVDITKPIKALDSLESLKNDEKLSMEIPEFQHFTTSNGVPVIFFETHQLPIVDVDLRFNAGSARDESIRKNGFGLANMVANLLTKGTKSLNETEFAEAAEQLGIELQSAAYKDQFVLSLRSLSDDANLTPAIGLMSSVINEPRFDADVVERTKAQQVLALKQMKQNPAYIASLTFSKALYGSHPYAHPSYGTVNSVPNLRVEDLQHFHDRYFVANNATLSLTGDLTIAEAKALAESITKDLPKGQPADELPTPKPVEKSKWVHVDYDSDQTSVIIGQLGYRLKTAEEDLQRKTAFSIGNEVLAGSGFSSRLMGKVRKELGYTYGISGGMTAMQTNGPYAIRFSTRNEKADDAIKATLETIDDTLENGVTKQEFALTKESLINSYPMGFSSNQGINRMLGLLNFNNLPDSYVTKYIDRVEGAQLDEVNQVLKDTITPEHFIIVTVGQPNIDADSKLTEIKVQPPSIDGVTD